MNKFELDNVIIEWLGHASFRISNKESNRKIYIDPFRIDVENASDANAILITHSHYDHFSPQDIEKIRTEKTRIYAPKDVSLKGNIHVVEPGLFFHINDHLKIETFPAYNINKPFHPKEKKWVSYKLTFNNEITVFHTGDSDVIPEFLDLQNLDVLMVPVSGTYVMTAEEAAHLCRKIRPKYAMPMHYGTIVGSRSDAERFKQLCDGVCKVIILDKA